MKWWSNWNKIWRWGIDNDDTLYLITRHTNSAANPRPRSEKGKPHLMIKVRPLSFLWNMIQKLEFNFRFKIHFLLCVFDVIVIFVNWEGCKWNASLTRCTMQNLSEIWPRRCGGHPGPGSESWSQPVAGPRPRLASAWWGAGARTEERPSPVGSHTPTQAAD